jgi:hypothetical protein
MSNQDTLALSEVRADVDTLERLIEEIKVKYPDLSASSKSEVESGDKHRHRPNHDWELLFGDYFI